MTGCSHAVVVAEQVSEVHDSPSSAQLTLEPAGDQALVLLLVSHTAHTFAGSVMGSATHAPPMSQNPAMRV